MTIYKCQKLHVHKLAVSLMGEQEQQGRTQGGCTGCTCIPPPPLCIPPPGHVHPPPPQPPERLVMRKDEAVGNKKKCKFVYLNIILN